MKETIIIAAMFAASIAGLWTLEILEDRAHEEKLRELQRRVELAEWKINQYDK